MQPWWCGLLLTGSLLAQQQPQSEIQKALDEFRVQTRNLGLRADSPAKGRRNGGSRAAWHGRLFENFRNDFLDAVPHEISQRGGSKSLLRRNQFGFNVSGPVVIPKLYHGARKTFFSLSYEGMRERISRSYLRTVPTTPERGGLFGETVDSAGALLPIYDPHTTRPNPAYRTSEPVSTENLQYLRDPFPENRIPGVRLDPVAQKALAFYPQPNAAAGPFWRNNYFVVSPETNTANGMIGKLDHTMRERQRLTFGWSFTNGFAGAAWYFPNAADPGPSDRVFSTRRGSLEHVLTLTPNTINSFTAEAVTDTSENSRGEPAGYAAQLGLRGAAGGAFPNLRFLPYLSMGRPNPVSRGTRNTFVWTDSFSQRRGKHNLRLIGQWAQYQVNAFVPAYPSGSLRFTSGLTSLPGINNTGHAFASFVLGLADYGELSQVASPSYFRRGSGLVAVRETYEAAKGLSFHFGVNLNLHTPRVEKYDRQTTVDLTVPNPVNGRPGALIAAGRDGVGRAFQPALTSLDPSASISWSPRGNPKNVIRLTYSRSHAAIPIYSSQFGTQGYTGSPIFLSPNVQLEPAFTLAQGLPAAKPLPDPRPEAANDTVADLIDRSGRQPVYHSYSLSFERELPGAVVVTAGAYNSGGRDLLLSTGNINLNAIRLENLSYRDRLNDEAFSRALRPFPQYRNFDLYSSWPAGRYRRAAGYVRVEKRSSKGLTVSASFEGSRQMDDYSGPHGTQDYFNRRNEWALTAYNSPRRLSMTCAYELPLGPSRLLLPYSDWRRHLAGGWSVSTISSFSTGEPLAPYPQFNNTGGVIGGLRVNLVPGVEARAGKQTAEQWFNPAAFDQPADFTPGDGPRTHPFLRNPGAQNHDLSLVKRFVLRADRTLEVSAVGLNFLNHANWNDPDAMIGPAGAPNVNAGRIIGSRGGRVMQLGMRFSF
ncbi:MAG: hypothetical protein HY822_05880 [Acidobacteria bacterium]|nr:hypothetical protein [Acidobacteriota bacterium]